MRSLRRWAARLAGLFGGRDAERDLHEEIDSHLLMHIDDNLRAGMSPEEARRAARLRLGSIEGLKERQRELRTVPFLQHIARDLRLAVRVLRRSPTFTIVTVTTLALGFGANTSIFTFVNAVLLRPLPYADSDRLAMIWATDAASGDRQQSWSYPDFETWRAEARSFEAVAAMTSRTVTVGGQDQAELVPAIQTTIGFFRMLRVDAALGRLFEVVDSSASAPPVAVLSDAAWKRHFAGRGDVIGQTVLVNQQPHTLLGVLPPGFQFLPTEAEQIYTLLPRETNRRHVYLRVMGRLRSRATLTSAQAEMNVLTQRIAAAFPDTNRGIGASVVPLHSVFAAPVREGLLILLGLVAAVLLIACTNVANLMLGRNAARGQELSLRMALGASRGRILQQLLAESLVLALAGAILGLLMAHAMTAALLAMLAGSVPIPRLDGVRIDGVVLAFTGALAMLTGLLFGAGPALVAAPGRVEAMPRDAGRRTAGSTRGRRTRAILVVAETAVALVLLAAGGMLARTFFELRATAPGFSAGNVLVVQLRLPAGLPPGPARASFYEQVRARVLQLPGVRSAGFVANLPMAGSRDSLQFRLHDRPGAKPVSASFNIAGPGYFRTMGIPVSAGREFSATDRASAPPALVVNESAARRFWPGANPIGRQIVLVGEPAVFTVVGVAGDVRQSDLGTAARPEIFLSALQAGPEWSGSAFVLSAASDPAPLVADVRAALRAENPDVAVGRIRTMDEVLAGTLAQPRVYTTLLAAFAGLALLLAAVGLYGVMSYSVTQRTRELGIRMALGASPGAIVASVLKHGFQVTCVGVALGLAGAYAATQSVANLLPGTRPGDPAMLAAVAVLLIVVALAASYLPARRAARVNPLDTLRGE